MVISALVSRLAAGSPLAVSPTVIDVERSSPPNPPEHVQVQFVGQSFEKAYAEAEAFVSTVEAELRAVGHPGLAASRVMDLGSGWGRISRVLLTQVAPSRLFAADVDPEMTALVNVSLPGINALTVTPEPPTVLADGSMDVAVAFSVFSHLSGAAHEAWARELARLVRPGGVVVITLLGEEFFDLVEGSQAAVAAGDTDDFTASVAEVFPDLAAVRAGFRADDLQFGATGGGGVRTSDYYGWAVVSRRAVERIWGDAGFELISWRPRREPISQALAVLVRTDRGVAARAGRRARRTVRHALGRAGERVRTRVPRPVRAIAGRVRRPRQL